MSFLDLPNETILQIAREQEFRDLNHLLRTNQRLARLLKTALIDNVCALREVETCKRALYAAANRGDKAIVQRLLDRGVLEFVGQGALLNDAVLSVEEPGLRVLIECGIDPETRDGEQQTPLCVASKNNRLEAVRLLMDDQRVDVNSTDRSGRTPLSLAAGDGHVQIVRALLEDTRVDVNLSCNTPSSSAFF